MMLCSGRMDISRVRFAPSEQAFGKMWSFPTRGEGVVSCRRRSPWPVEGPGKIFCYVEDGPGGHCGCAGPNHLRFEAQIYAKSWWNNVNSQGTFDKTPVSCL